MIIMSSLGFNAKWRGINTNWPRINVRRHEHAETRHILVGVTVTWLKIASNWQGANLDMRLWIVVSLLAFCINWSGINTRWQGIGINQNMMRVVVDLPACASILSCIDINGLRIQMNWHPGFNNLCLHKVPLLEGPAPWAESIMRPLSGGSKTTHAAKSRTGKRSRTPWGSPRRWECSSLLLAWATPQGPSHCEGPRSPMTDRELPGWRGGQLGEEAPIIDVPSWNPLH